MVFRAWLNSQKYPPLDNGEIHQSFKPFTKVRTFYFNKYNEHSEEIINLITNLQKFYADQYLSLAYNSNKVEHRQTYITQAEEIDPHNSCLEYFKYKAGTSAINNLLTSSPNFFNASQKVTKQTFIASLMYLELLIETKQWEVVKRETKKIDAFLSGHQKLVNDYNELASPSLWNEIFNSETQNSKLFQSQHSHCIETFFATFFERSLTTFQAFKAEQLRKMLLEIHNVKHPDNITLLLSDIVNLMDNEPLESLYVAIRALPYPANQRLFNLALVSGNPLSDFFKNNDFLTLAGYFYKNKIEVSLKNIWKQAHLVRVPVRSKSKNSQPTSSELKSIKFVKPTEVLSSTNSAEDKMAPSVEVQDPKSVSVPESILLESKNAQPILETPPSIVPPLVQTINFAISFLPINLYAASLRGSLICKL
jgi:hypothetical protein